MCDDIRDGVREVQAEILLYVMSLVKELNYIGRGISMGSKNILDHQGQETRCQASDRSKAVPSSFPCGEKQHQRWRSCAEWSCP
jgi:hypothetical protein